MKVNKGLGRGLNSLFQEANDEYNKNLGVTQEELTNGVSEISLDDIYANPNQPRKLFEPNALNELAQSIKINGVITPIVLNKDDEGKFMIIAGERRYRASKIAGLKTIPAVIKEYDERKIKEISLIENLQREDLNPIEEANAMKELMDQYDLTQEELSERLSKSRSAIANTLRLLSLQSDVLSMVVKGDLSAGHARALVTLPLDKQLEYSKEILKKNLSVREIEQMVKDYFNPNSKINKKNNNGESQSDELKDLIDRMKRTLATKVGAIGNDNKGRIYIDYYTRDDLDRLSDMISFLENNKKV